MKIVAINGSPRKNGNTARLLEAVGKEVRAAGCGDNQLHHKVGGALCTLRRSGGMETYQQLLGTMDAMEMLIVTSDYWGAVHGADPGECLEDAEGMEVACKLGRNMAWAVKALAAAKETVPPPATARRTMTNFIR